MHFWSPFPSYRPNKLYGVNVRDGCSGTSLSHPQFCSPFISGGGIGWTGPTTCVAGSVCTYQNDWYSQCLPGSTTAGPTTTTTTQAPPTTTTTSGPAPSGSGLNSAAKAAGKLYFGTAVDGPGLSDQPYLTILRNTGDFGQITAANAMKWVCITSDSD